MTLHVEVVSPERILWQGEADMVTARTLEGGDISFLTGHTPFVGALAIGPVIIRPPEGDDVKLAVHGGFVEVSNDRVSLLTDVAELAEHIDISRAEEALRRAEAELTAEGNEDAEEAKRRADVRLTVGGTIASGMV
jgi:F-type H+-transporting ATPase subunit epsilon